MMYKRFDVVCEACSNISSENMKQTLFIWMVFCSALVTGSTSKTCLFEKHRFLEKENITLSEDFLIKQFPDVQWAFSTVTTQEFSSMVREGDLTCGAVLAVGDCAFCGLLQAWADALSLPYTCVGPGSCPSLSHLSPGAASPLRPALTALADVAVFLKWTELFFIFDDTLDDDSFMGFVAELSNSHISTIFRKVDSSRGNKTHQIQENLNFVERFPANNVIIFVREETIYTVFAEAKNRRLFGRGYSWLAWAEGLRLERVPPSLHSLLLVVPRLQSASCSLGNATPAGQSSDNITVSSQSSGCHDGSDCSVAMADQLFQATLEKAIQTLTKGAQPLETTHPRIGTVAADVSTAMDVCSVAWRPNRGLQSTLMASWTSKTRLQMLDAPNFRPGFQDFGGATINIASVPWAPFVNEHVVNGSITYDGFCVDIITELAKRLNFRIEIVQPVDRKFGAVSNGVWNGMVGMVMRGEASMAIGPFTLTPERDTVIDFTTTLMEDGVAILTLQSDAQDVDVFKIFAPLKLQVWLGLLGATLATALVLYVVNHFSPFAQSTNVLPTANPRRLSTNLWLVFSSFVLQGGDPHPRSVSGRCVLGFWWLFTILMTSTYTANLAAFLTVTVASKPINSLAELVAQTDIKPIISAGTNLETLLQEATEGLYKTAWDLRDKNLEVTEINELVALVRTGRYAFMIDSSVLEHIVNEDCKTFALSEQTFNTAGLGFIMPEDAPFADVLNENLLKMQEAGLVSLWRQKWWPKSDKCSVSQPSSQAQVLGLRSLGGPFILQSAVMVGAGIAALLPRALACLRARVRRRSTGRGGEADREDGTGEEGGRHADKDTERDRDIDSGNGKDGDRGGDRDRDIDTD